MHPFLNIGWWGDNLNLLRPIRTFLWIAWYFKYSCLYCLSLYGRKNVVVCYLFFKHCVWCVCVCIHIEREIYLSMCVHAQSFSLAWLFATTWTVAHQASLSIEFSRQEYWNGLPFPSPGDLPDPGIKPASLALAGRFFTTESPIFYYLFSCTGLGCAMWDLVPWPGIEPRAPALGV